MDKMQSIFIILVLIHAFSVSGSTFEVLQQTVVVNSSELWIRQINPAIFKWEQQRGYVNQIQYLPKLANSPDLPGWLRYTYDSYTSTGYLYGVPPPQISSINLDIIAWNKAESYDVRKLTISLEMLKKQQMKYVIELKIDNFNVKDLAATRKMGELAKILSDQLSWVKHDGSRVVPTFMASAVALGENRVPVKPNDAEGVVVNFASDLDFSTELKKLMEEVSPLWKLRPCPRDLKRTSVERHFRKYNFLVDWCSFRLSTLSDLDPFEDVEPGKESHSGGSFNNDGIGEGDSHKINFPSEPEIFTFISEVPERDYRFEMLVSTVIPGSIGVLVGFLLIVLLRTDRDEDVEIDEDGLFFEAAFRTLFSLLRMKQQPRNGNGNGNGRQYIYHQAQQDAGVVVMTRDNGTNGSIDERELQSTPIPPQYAEMHPNGAPALIYAV